MAQYVAFCFSDGIVRVNAEDPSTLASLIASQILSTIHHPTHYVLEEYAMSRLSRSALKYSYFRIRGLATEVEVGPSRISRRLYLQSFFRYPSLRVSQSIDAQGEQVVKQYRCKYAQDRADKYGFRWASRYEFEQIKRWYEPIWD